MEFRKAEKDDLDQVYKLYKSVVGTPFCVWDEQYPDWYDIHEDDENGTLYVMAEGDTIVGAISIIVHNELDELDFWTIRDAREIARVVVDPKHQGKGIAGKMVEEIADVLRKQGLSAIHLLVAEANPPAQRVYQKAGFQTLGTCFMFGHDYFGCELPL